MGSDRKSPGDFRFKQRSRGETAFVGGVLRGKQQGQGVERAGSGKWQEGD